MSEKEIRKCMANLAAQGFRTVAKTTGVDLREVAEVMAGYGLQADFAFEKVKSGEMRGFSGGPGSTK